MLTNSNFKIMFRFPIVSNIAITTQYITYVLHCGNVLPTEMCKRFLKFIKKVPKNGRTMNNSILGTVGTI